MGVRAVLVGRIGVMDFAMQSVSRLTQLHFCSMQPPKRSDTILKPLKPRERAFVIAYLGECKFDARLAAIRAGYSAKTAQQQGARILKRERVATAVLQAQQIEPGEDELTREQFLRICSKNIKTGGQHAAAWAAHFVKVKGWSTETHRHVDDRIPLAFDAAGEEDDQAEPEAGGAEVHPDDGLYPTESGDIDGEAAEMDRDGDPPRVC